MSFDFNYPLTRYVYRPLSRPLASALARTFVTPIQLTWVSAVFALGGGVAFGFGYYILGVGLTLIAQIADCADGDLARITERSSRSGAFLDSVLDRWTDAALVVGLGFSNPDRFGTAAALALVGSFLTSYTRARAQSLGADCPEGIATRDVRMLVLMVAALSGYILAGLWTVATLGFLTSIQRMVMAMRDLDKFDARDRVSKKLREDDAGEHPVETLASEMEAS
ncbi:MAG TPA: CDP-alcohol phosphatidyltransferase family protein [Actinomycetota bacterium]|nr:CDP-alcohol phosphatidyltransferase family protein [Actinomycetota bacterium]